MCCMLQPIYDAQQRIESKLARRAQEITQVQGEIQPFYGHSSTGLRIKGWMCHENAAAAVESC